MITLTLYTCPYVPLPTTSTSSKIPAGSCGENAAFRFIHASVPAWEQTAASQFSRYKGLKRAEHLKTNESDFRSLHSEHNTFILVFKWVMFALFLNLQSYTSSLECRLRVEAGFHGVTLLLFSSQGPPAANFLLNYPSTIHPSFWPHNSITGSHIRQRLSKHPGHRPLKGFSRTFSVATV